MTKEEKLALARREFSKNRLTGRPTKYKPEYCQKLISYFRDTKPYRTIVNAKGEEVTVPNERPTILKWCDKNKISHDTFYQWIAKQSAFAEAVEKAKKYHEEYLIENGLRNNFAQAMTVFTLKNLHGWTDKTEVKTENKSISVNLDLENMSQSDKINTIKQIIDQDK